MMDGTKASRALFAGCGLLAHASPSRAKTEEEEGEEEEEEEEEGRSSFRVVIILIESEESYLAK